MSTIKNTPKWTSEELNTLYALFPSERKEIVIEKLGRKWNAICQVARRHNLNRKCSHRRSHKNWPDSEIEKLKTLYPISTQKQLKLAFPHKTPHSIEEYARRKGLKKDLTVPFLHGRKGDLNVLLEDKDESYYWIGFIFADGYIHHKSHHLVIFIDKKDKLHLQQYADYVGSKIKTYTEIKQFGADSLPYKSTMCRVAVAQKTIVPKIIDKFGFKPTKTYNPPDVKLLEQVLNTKERFISFLAGFIDGDGSMYNSCIKIENHASWVYIHNLFKILLIKFYNFKSEDFMLEINKRGYSEIEIRNNTNLGILKKDLIQLKLPIMKRKWDRIDINKIALKDKYSNLNKSILESIDDGLTIPEIGKSLNISEDTLRSYIHRKNIKYNRIRNKS